ncbi:hypothetical protein, partial [Candidatus Thiosymbion oneisti]|uniref:hypothetical protein n=1 Tax=Candidatus Thiosymbion oneisti TaxID=589554 RepID=UPI0034E2C2C2
GSRPEGQGERVGMTTGPERDAGRARAGTAGREGTAVSSGQSSRRTAERCDGEGPTGRAIRQARHDGSDQPQPVSRAWIPKPTGAGRGRRRCRRK